MFLHLKLFTSFELCQTKAIIKFYALFLVATYVLAGKNSLGYLMGTAHVSFVYKQYSRHTKRVTSVFHVIYHHFLRVDIEMLPANRSQRNFRFSPCILTINHF